MCVCLSIIFFQSRAGRLGSYQGSSDNILSRCHLSKGQIQTNGFQNGQLLFLGKVNNTNVGLLLYSRDPLLDFRVTGGHTMKYMWLPRGDTTKEGGGEVASVSFSEASQHEGVWGETEVEVFGCKK